MYFNPTMNFTPPLLHRLLCDKSGIERNKHMKSRLYKSIIIIPRSRRNDGSSPRVPLLQQTCCLADLIVYNDPAKICVKQCIELV